MGAFTHYHCLIMAFIVSKIIRFAISKSSYQQREINWFLLLFSIITLLMWILHDFRKRKTYDEGVDFKLLCKQQMWWWCEIIVFAITLWHVTMATRLFIDDFFLLLFFLFCFCLSLPFNHSISFHSSSDIRCSSHCLLRTRSQLVHSVEPMMAFACAFYSLCIDILTNHSVDTRINSFGEEKDV